MREWIDHAGMKERITHLLHEAGAPGAAVALISDGQPWTAGVGVETPDGRPMPPNARFALYSITKTVIATIVLRLAERGEIALDAPIRTYVANLPAGAEVPVRRVLDHSGGFPDYGALPAYQAAVRSLPPTAWDDATFLSHAMAKGMLFAPGEGWRYSNIGYMLLRHLIERVSGGSFRDAVREVAALQVVTTRDGMRSLAPGFSTLPDPDGDPVNVIPRYHPGWVAHGLATGTAPETAAFLDRLMRGEIVTPRSLAAMRDAIPVAETHPWMTTPSYGLGLMVDPDNRYGIVAGHTGGGPGCSTAAYHFPDIAGRRVTAVALVNADTGDTATAIAFSMADALALAE